MFTDQEKIEISDKIQQALQEMNHPELSDVEIEFRIHIEGKHAFGWADIQNNSAAKHTLLNIENERLGQTL